jgi:CRISPR-associated protein Cas5d
MYYKNDFKIIVTGDYACFTMPQFKTERVSYDYPTPSALTGLIESVYYKPAIKIIIDKIIVFNPINHINIKTK